MGKEEDIMKAKQLKILGTFVMVTMIHGTPVLAGGGDTGIEIHGQQTGNNVSLGSGSLASNENNPAKWTGVGNTAIGFEALYKNTYGHRNTAIGTHALTNNVGHHNTASGFDALYKNTHGHHNTASGFKALRYNTVGHHNTAVGAEALYKNIEGNANTAIGYWSLIYNTVGHHNTASGAEALMYNTTGNNNTASGHGALWANIKGNDNTASGLSALSANITGHGNTAIGYQAGGSNKSGSKNVFIGYQAGNNVGYTNKSNQLVIGNGPLPANQLLVGDFSKRTLLINGRTSINGDAMVRGNLKVQGKAFAASFEKSDGRLKKDIKPLNHALDSILQLQGKTYRWKEDTTFANKADIGLVAQDVEKVFPELVFTNKEGLKTVAYGNLIAPLIEAFKAKNEAQDNKIKQLSDQIRELKNYHNYDY